MGLTYRYDIVPSYMHVRRVHLGPHFDMAAPGTQQIPQALDEGVAARPYWPHELVHAEGTIC